MEPGIYVNERNNKQISQHSQQVDDQKKEEEQNLCVWILWKAQEDKFSHICLVSFFHEYLIFFIGQHQGKKAHTYWSVKNYLNNKYFINQYTKLGHWLPTLICFHMLEEFSFCLVVLTVEIPFWFYLPLNLSVEPESQQSSWICYVTEPWLDYT